MNPGTSCFACGYSFAVGDKVTEFQFGNIIERLCERCHETYQDDLRRYDQLMSELARLPLYRLWLKSIDP